MTLKTEECVWLGLLTIARMQVREFSFSPDSGRIQRIQFDRFGLPALSDSVVSVFGLPAEDVVRVEFARLLVRRSPRVVKETEGILDKATEALFAIKVRPMSYSSHHTTLPATGGLWLKGDSLQAPDEDDEYARRYEEWERKYGAAYRQYSGEVHPAEPACHPRVAWHSNLIS